MADNDHDQGVEAPRAMAPRSTSHGVFFKENLDIVETSLSTILSPSRVVLPSGSDDRKPLTTPAPNMEAGSEAFEDHVLRSKVDVMWKDLKVALDAYRKRAEQSLSAQQKSLLAALGRAQQGFMEVNKHPIYDIEAKMTKEDRIAKAKEAGYASVMAALSTVSGGAEIAAQLGQSLQPKPSLLMSPSATSFTREGMMQKDGTLLRDTSAVSLSSVSLSSSSPYASTSTLHAVSTTVRAQAEALRSAAIAESTSMLKQADADSQVLVDMCLAQFRVGLHAIIDFARDHIAWLRGKNELQLRDLRTSVQQQVSDMLAASRADMREKLRQIHERHAKDMAELQNGLTQRINAAAMSYKSISMRLKNLKELNDALRDCILAIGAGAGLNTSILIPPKFMTVTLLADVGEGEISAEHTNAMLQPLLSNEDPHAKGRRKSLLIQDAPARKGLPLLKDDAHAQAKVVKVVSLPADDDKMAIVSAVVARVQAMINLEREYYEMKDKLAATETRAVAWEQNAKEARYTVLMKEAEVRELNEDKSRLSKQLNEAQTEIMRLREEIKTYQSILSDKDKAIAFLTKELERFQKEKDFKDSMIQRLQAEVESLKEKCSDAEYAVGTVKRRRSIEGGNDGKSAANNNIFNKAGVKPFQVDRAAVAKMRESVLLPSLADIVATHVVGGAEDASTPATAVKRGVGVNATSAAVNAAGVGVVAVNPASAAVNTAGAAANDAGVKVLRDVMRHQKEVQLGRRRAMSVTAAMERLAFFHNAILKKKGPPPRRPTLTKSKLSPMKADASSDTADSANNASSKAPEMFSAAMIALHAGSADVVSTQLAVTATAFDFARKAASDMHAQVVALQSEKTALQHTIAESNAATAALRVELETSASKRASGIEAGTQTESLAVDSAVQVGSENSDAWMSVLPESDVLQHLLSRFQAAEHDNREVTLHPDAASSTIAYLQGYTIETSSPTTFRIEVANTSKVPELVVSPRSRLACPPAATLDEQLGDWVHYQRQPSESTREWTVGEHIVWQVLPRPLVAPSRKRRASAPAFQGVASVSALRFARLLHVSEASDLTPAQRVLKTADKAGRNGWVVKTPIGPIFVSMDAGLIPVYESTASALPGAPTRMLAPLHKVSPLLSSPEREKDRDGNSWLHHQFSHLERMVKSSSNKQLTRQPSGLWFDPETAIPISYEERPRGEPDVVVNAMMDAVHPITVSSSRKRLQPLSQSGRRARSRELALQKVVDVVLAAVDAQSPVSSLEDLSVFGGAADKTFESIMSARVVDDDDFVAPLQDFTSPGSSRGLARITSRKSLREGGVTTARLPPLQLEAADLRSAAITSPNASAPANSGIWPMNYVPASAQPREQRTGRLLQRFSSRERLGFSRSASPGNETDARTTLMARSESFLQVSRPPAVETARHARISDASNHSGQDALSPALPHTQSSLQLVRAASLEPLTGRGIKPHDLGSERR